MPQATYRPKNECHRCGYTWHPRGKNRSLRCPSCGGRNVIEYEHAFPDLAVKLFVGGILSIILTFVIVGNFSKENEFAMNMAGLFGLIGLVSAGLGSVGLSE